MGGLEGAVWFVNHGSKRIWFEFVFDRGHLDDARAIISSVAFAAVSLSTFIDTNGLVLLQYPSEWMAWRDTKFDPNNALLLETDNAFVNLGIYRRPTTDDFADFRATSVEVHPSLAYTWSEPQATTVGGEPARSMAYRFTEAGDDYVHTGTLWLVDHQGRRFSFQCEDMGKHGHELIAVMGSVRFLK